MAPQGLSWSGTGLRWWNEDDMVSVTVIIELPEDNGIAEWRIFVENNSDYWGMWSVLFPIVNGFPESGKYDVARPSFARGGELIRGCDQKQSGRYPGSVWPMQFVSFNRGSDGVYLATMDPEARAKEFVIEPVKDLEVRDIPFYSMAEGTEALTRNREKEHILSITRTIWGCRVPTIPIITRLHLESTREAGKKQQRFTDPGP